MASERAMEVAKEVEDNCTVYGYEFLPDTEAIAAILDRFAAEAVRDKEEQIARLTEENERLRDELQQCHEELAEAWEVNIESVDVMLAEKRDRVKRFRSGGEEKA